MENLDNAKQINQLKLNVSSFDVFNGGGNYINLLRMYFGYFNEIPNIKAIDNIDITAMRQWIAKEMFEDIIKTHYNQTYHPSKKKNFYSDHFFLLKNQIIINLYQQSVYIVFETSLENKAQELQDKLLKFQLKSKRTTQISFIISNNKGLLTKKIDIKMPKINIDLHYNDDFKKTHQLVVKNLKKLNTKGLYLFHGLPGTGKSTYVKYLIHQQNKQVIFLSPKIAGNLDDLAFTEFLLDNPNCVLVIEDAEDLIISRENQHNSRLSFLLNMTDGLLGESLGIQVIATFNTDLKNIDKALLRKGRLTAIYDFKPLTVNKTNDLLKKLGHDIEVDNSLSLAEIFNFEVETNYRPKLRKAIGFGN
ncbi:MAG: AAA family ATPase [Flavobacterium sp.]|jgi:hypothetical protein|nr:AAA family ATPase [Flavobacterium sp.]